MRQLLTSIATLSILFAAAPANAVSWVSTLALPNGTDKSDFGPEFAGNRLGGFGSDLVYDAGSNLFYSITDRGPGGGVIDYAPRLQIFSLDIDGAGAASNFALVDTVVFRNKDLTPFTGLNPLLGGGDRSILGKSLDSEGLVRLPNGHYLISDEYGPSVYEFGGNGIFVRAFETPDNLIPREAGGAVNYVDGRPTITSGRQDNRGFEGLTVSPDGKTAYAILQDPLVNEGAQDDGRRSRNVRIVAFDVESGESTGQYVYQLEDRATLNTITPGNTFSATNQGRSIGNSAIVALPDGRLVVLERDNRGFGVDDPTAATPVALKAAFVIDLDGATDVSSISLADSNSLPAGVIPVSKTLLADFRAALIAAGQPVAEKIEGLAFGRYLSNGGISLVLITDNDFSVTQTGDGTQFDRCTDGIGGAGFTDVAIGLACPNGQSLIPTYIYTFALSRQEALQLGFTGGVPEPATWAMMIAGFGLVGGAVRRRRTLAAA